MQWKVELPGWLKCICGFHKKVEAPVSHMKMEELNPKGYATSDEVKANLEELLKRANALRNAYGKPMVVTSGLRSDEDQKRVNPKAPKSRHLKGKAMDVKDPNGDLAKWCKENVAKLEEIGFWMEEPEYTKGWVPFQSEAPKSGRRFFIP